MDQTTELVALIAAATLGIAGTLGILRRERVASDPASHDRPFAVATEGMLRCPACGMGNLVGDSTCSSCRKTLPK
jgi:hypothetical protein